jgi:hypothetical protein
MIDQVLTELDALSRRGEYTDEDDLVFVSPEGSHLEDSALRWRFYAALEAAVIKPLRFHEYADVFVMPTFGRKAGRTGLIAA